MKKSNLFGIAVCLLVSVSGITATAMSKKKKLKPKKRRKREIYISTETSKKSFPKPNTGSKSPLKERIDRLNLSPEEKVVIRELEKERKKIHEKSGEVLANWLTFHSLEEILNAAEEKQWKEKKESQNILQNFK